MTTHEIDAGANGAAIRREWLDRIEHLAGEVETWARVRNWPVVRESKAIIEDTTGAYDAPIVRVRTPQGEVRLEPIGCDIAGARGRVDLEAWPSLNRVMLIWRGNPPQMIILTDSLVPLRLPWNSDTFAQLATDLLAE